MRQVNTVIDAPFIKSSFHSKDIPMKTPETNSNFSFRPNVKEEARLEAVPTLVPGRTTLHRVSAVLPPRENPPPEPVSSDFPATQIPVRRSITPYEAARLQPYLAPEQARYPVPIQPVSRPPHLESLESVVTRYDVPDQFARTQLRRISQVEANGGLGVSPVGEVKYLEAVAPRQPFMLIDQKQQPPRQVDGDIKSVGVEHEAYELLSKTGGMEDRPLSEVDANELTANFKQMIEEARKSKVAEAP